MDEYINKQVLMDIVEESRRLNHHQDGKEACAHEYEHRHFLKIILDSPSADVQPVVHGKWIKIEYHAYRCSECGKSIITNCDYIKEHKFCFRCGAKMNGKGADNE